MLRVASSATAQRASVSVAHALAGREPLPRSGCGGHSRARNLRLSHEEQASWTFVAPSRSGEEAKQKSKWMFLSMHYVCQHQVVSTFSRGLIVSAGASFFSFTLFSASRPMPPQTPFPVAFLAEPKIDGISCALRFRARVLDSALRRPPTLPLAGDVVTLSVTASGLFGAVPPSEGEDAPASPGASASLEDLSGAPVQSASASASAASSSPSTFSSLVLWDFVDASSRGNGVWGEDISHTVRAMSEAGRLPLAFATRLRSAQPLSPATLSRWLLEVSELRVVERAKGATLASTEAHSSATRSLSACMHVPTCMNRQTPIDCILWRREGVAAAERIRSLSASS
ncbi:putative DNA ligase (NAD+) [Toxoplasma gondii ARI]|uniref:Putative DNA ligase (NAD+) n=1 Tax=Toxoplasma gondii ARI TaxID=1074872 RepID=A0A139XMY8_TOXGO|nr:putative DNA ligase (NAD+) [Toxoplasma gondii ARI]